MGGFNKQLKCFHLLVPDCTKYFFMVELRGAAPMSVCMSKFEVYNSGYNLLQLIKQAAMQNFKVFEGR